MSIIDGKGLVEWEGGLFEPGSDLLARVQWAFGQIRSRGGVIVLNEAGRPYGVSSDQYARSASQTASGISTVWFQWGRFLRGETPAAANPALGVLASEHTQGIAIDCDAKDVYTAALRATVFPQAGLKNTITSESWHWAIRGNPTVNITTAASAAKPIQTTQEEDDDMAAGVLLREANGTIWYAPDDGDLIPLTSQDEVNALIACGAVRQITTPAGVKVGWIQLADGLILNKRKAIAARKRQQIAAAK